MELPLTSVQRIIKSALPAHIQLGKDVRNIFAKSAAIFILYLTNAYAHLHCIQCSTYTAVCAVLMLYCAVCAACAMCAVCCAVCSANDFAHDHKRSTISGDDVMAAAEGTLCVCMCMYVCVCVCVCVCVFTC